MKTKIFLFYSVILIGCGAYEPEQPCVIEVTFNDGQKQADTIICRPSWLILQRGDLIDLSGNCNAFKSGIREYKIVKILPK